jgi:ribosomal protein S12 methylthiotransferase
VTIKVGLVSLGCSKNLVDSECMLGLIDQAGMTVSSTADDADALIVNTCGFIEPAIEESVDTILELVDYKKQGTCRALIIAGCLSQRYQEKLLSEFPEVDAVLGTADLHRIVEVIEQALAADDQLNFVGSGTLRHTEPFPRLLATPSYTAYIKISEGCSHSCSFCVIPELRGPHVSRPTEEIVAEAADLVQGGVRELNLLAQDSTYYGVDLYGEQRLPTLLRHLDEVSVDWIRLLYAYPGQLTERIMHTLAELDSVVNYVDMPLQHASDRILERMRRPERRAGIIERVEQLRQYIPNVSLRTTFIVGFPGETEEDFRQLLELVRELEFDHVGTFMYSQEPGTQAAELPGQLPAEVKEQRYHRLMQVQQEVSNQRLQRFVGQRLTVLVEGEAHYEEAAAENRYLGGLKPSGNGVLGSKPTLYFGRHQGQAPDVDGVVLFELEQDSHEEPRRGQFVQVEITDAAEYDLVGLLCEE